MPRTIAALAAILVLTTGAHADESLDIARRNADQASELFGRCHRFVEGWLAHADPASGLIPQNLNSPHWTPENSAADNYPFMVLSAWATTDEAQMARLTDMLHTENRLTTRVRSLPDSFSFVTQGFSREQLDRGRLIFGASEYCKDGLLPMTELMGRTEWFNRLRSIAEDICLESRAETAFGPIPSGSAEVNGEMMQVLSRLYPATGNTDLLEMALRLGDAYFLEALPGAGYLPCHGWDFAGHRATNPVLRLNDHGSEICGGLSEVYALAGRYAPERQAKWQPSMARFMETLVDHCRKEDGLWYQTYNTATGEGSGGTPDTWGYILNGVYTYYLLTGETKYRDVVEEGMRAICTQNDWGGADAYADSIESGVVLLNRVEIPETWDWVDRMTAKMSAIQKADGVIEGWHGDGNVARTWLMVAFARTAGCRVAPWREDVKIGATLSDDGEVLVSVRADKPWSGRVIFDRPRYRENFNLAIDYPRLNQYAEWFTAADGNRYAVSAADGKTATYDGGVLSAGLPVEIPAGGEWIATVSLASEPPHGISTLEVTGPTWVAVGEDAEVVLVVKNRSDAPTEAVLDSDWGRVAPASMQLAGKGRAAVAVRGSVGGDRDLVVTARAGVGSAAAVHRVHLIADPRVTDYQDMAGEVYQGESYLWLNTSDIVLHLKAEPGRDHTLSLYWGSKNDERLGNLTVGDETRELKHGGYDGFEWLKVDIPARLLTGPYLDITLTKPAEGKAAFIGRAKLRTE